MKSSYSLPILSTDKMSCLGNARLVFHSLNQLQALQIVTEAILGQVTIQSFICKLAFIEIRFKYFSTINEKY